jgi:group I intron endonuclease
MIINIGFLENLNRRFTEYFRKNYLLIHTCMYICKALLKYGYSNFSLTILEYCEVLELLIREKYYIDLLESEYNILKDPTLPPMLGRKHSDETKKIMLGRTHSEETKKKLSDARFGQPRHEGAGKPVQQIEVFDEKTNKTTTYNSISAAASTLNVKHSTIVNYFARNQSKPFKGQFTFKKI